MKIVVLSGGNSTERDVSINTGYSVAKALKKSKHKVMFLDVLFGTDQKLFASTENLEETKEMMLKNTKKVSKTKNKSFFGKNVLNICNQSDIVFLSLHGKNGEDGKIQATFELLGIKYTGADYLSSILAMDKSLTKLKLKENNILTADYLVLNQQSKIPKIKKYPKVIKTTHGGSSIGVYIVNNEHELKDKVKKAFKIDNQVLIEDYVKGREFSVGIIKDKALPVIEIEPKSGFYDYKNKYTKDLTIETCPANISKNLEKNLKSLTKKIAQILNINTYARIDFIVTDKNETYCLEVNTLPGMTDTSLLPKEALALKISYEQLCEKLIDVSLK